MEIRKTTLLSFLVCIAGILTEIIFRDVLVKSSFGVALSVLLALIIIVLAYFCFDGLFSLLIADRELDRKRQEDYDRKLYMILNEQIHVEKAIYKEVHVLLEKSENAGGLEGASVGVLEECLKRMETLQATVEGQEGLGKIQDSVQAFTEKQADLEKTQEDILLMLEDWPDLGQLQEDIAALLEKQPELGQTQEDIRSLTDKQPELESIQSDIQTIIQSESELKENQSEIQESIRKLAEIMGVLLSLLRRKKPDDANDEKTEE